MAAMMVSLLTISINWNPNIVEFGPFTLTWHGITTALGIAAGVYVAGRLGFREGFVEDDAYSIALVGVPAGIIGARAMFVLENQVRFQGQWLDALKINEGGITVYGAVIGGVLGAVIYGLIRRLPVARGLDVAGFGMLLGMAIGRIGDLINGEHISRVSSLPWAVKYTNPGSPGYGFSVQSSGGFIARHPATTYEMIGDLLIIGIMALLFMRFWRHRPAITFFSGVVLYSAMRFGVSYLRIDSCPTQLQCPEYIVKNWMTFPQVVSVITFAVGSLGLIWSILRAPQEAPKLPGTPAASTRAPAQASARYRA
ncbi:MAG: prolipoprotein diacylglyceryl transferase [Chloroflexi bacterium]|nr:prolipoprotein diacylglyceryl transferase [Chloroflexota bacterium]